MLVDLLEICTPSADLNLLKVIETRGLNNEHVMLLKQ